MGAITDCTVKGAGITRDQVELHQIPGRSR